ncbi:MAG: cytidylate kinase-like family protein [Candidatus Methanomethylophilaceae archaeon]|nr:cytidylate kinase-like family protein [Candidatus Methanomethylophilaceae archaeon]
MSDLIITIARQNGSGGREVGKILADLLGIRCYDQEILAEAANESGISLQEIEKKEERTSRTNMFFYGIPAPNPVFVAQSKAIETLAANGPCVFVGRCADYVLHDRSDVINVFVKAPMEARVARSSKRNNISEKEAFARVKDKDSERALYYQRYTGIVWGTVENYDLTIDTSVIGVENAAKLIIEYARMAGYKL